MFILAGMGGAWTPLEFTSSAFQHIAAFTPIAWMVDGFKDIIVRGLGLQAVLLADGVLLLWRRRSLGPGSVALSLWGEAQRHAQRQDWPGTFSCSPCSRPDRSCSAICLPWL